MNDAVQDFRIGALERALASLTVGAAAQPQPTNHPAVAVPQLLADPHQDARIVSLENAVVALGNSVALLNQQMASLSDELQKQSGASNMITITPTDTRIDTAQNARLDGIDTLVETLAKNVADYNNQMSSLIAQYQSMKPRSKAATSGNGTKSF